MKNLVIISLTLLIVACNTVSYKPYSESEVTNSVNSITTTNRDGGFFLVDYVNQDTGEIVYDFMLSDLTGKGLIAKYGLTNPRDLIKTDLVSDISKTLNAKVIESKERISFHTDEQTYASIPTTYKNADLILDIVTTTWSMDYESEKYQVFLEAESRLIEQKTGNLVAFNHCKPNTDTSGKYSEVRLLENNAALLKAEIAKLSKECAIQLHQAMFPSRGQ